jgi:hypothetical protein
MEEVGRFWSLLEVIWMSIYKFKGFFQDRKEKILQRIEKAMGKIIARDIIDQDEGEYVDNAEDDNELYFQGDVLQKDQGA